VDHFEPLDQHKETASEEIAAKQHLYARLPMIRYVDGTFADVGDTILIDNGARHGRVIEVIEGETLLRHWGVELPGVMVESDYYGLLFVPGDQISDMGCRLVSRANT
jgi:hypothetical protein